MNNYNDPNQQYGQPAQPQYGQPAQPQYTQPAQQQYAQPAQPQYAQPQYAQPAQPQYAQPQYAQPAAPAKAGNPMLAPFLVGLIGSIVMVLSLFMPFLSATALNVTESISFLGGSSELVARALDGVGEVMMVIGIFLLIFYGLTLLFAILKKPVPQLIFAIVSASIFMIIHLIFAVAIAELGAFGAVLSFGAGVYLFYLGVAAAIAGSIWTMVARKKVAAPAPAAPVMPY